MLEEREKYYAKLIKESDSLIEVCRKAKIVPTTGNYDTLKKVIRSNNIDISHFKRNCVKSHVVKRDIEDYLNNKYPITSFKLKNKLLKEGYKECRCEKCGNTEWYGKPIPLELHHINGDNTDNRIENLQILCPNCHSFTDTYGGRNQKLNITRKEKQKKEKGLTEDEKNEIINSSFNSDSIKKIARETNHSERTVKKVLEINGVKINKNREIKENNDKKIPLIIESLKKTKSFSGTAREFGVSDNAIKKLLVKRGYPKHIKEILENIE